MISVNTTQPEQLLAKQFIELWVKIANCSSSQRASAKTPNTDFIKRIEVALQENSAQNPLNLINQLLIGNTASNPIERGNILAIMRVMDDMFYLIHPRAVIAPKFRPHLPDWLLQLQGAYFLSGHYGCNEKHSLIPRGPLLRMPREESAANAENLADRFVALAVVELKHNHNGRDISIQHKIISSDTARGVPSGAKIGAETVAFIPIAEEKDHLETIETKISDQMFVDFRINSGLNSAELLFNALVQAGSVDIAIAPEMVVSEDHADDLANKLLNYKGITLSRIIIAGSGATKATDQEGMPWNETRIFNGRGHELWRQRKIWPAGLDAKRVKDLNLSKIDSNKMMLEYNAAGNEIFIVDVDGLGRCIVLICQDIQAEPVSKEIIRQFQPDWVFSPILDPGIEKYKWVHQRIFSLCGEAQTRFLVASSTALNYWFNPTKNGACGFAHGPKKSSTLDDEGRSYTIANVEGDASPGYAKVIWRSKNGWQITTFS